MDARDDLTERFSRFTQQLAGDPVLVQAVVDRMVTVATNGGRFPVEGHSSDVEDILALRALAWVLEKKSHEGATDALANRFMPV